MTNTQALATALKLMYFTREDNCIDGIELPDTITMPRKDFELIGDTLATVVVDLKRQENPELGEMMQNILDLGKKLEADES